jgi:hypothetical protein
VDRLAILDDDSPVGRVHRAFDASLSGLRDAHSATGSSARQRIAFLLIFGNARFPFALR